MSAEVARSWWGPRVKIALAGAVLVGVGVGGFFWYSRVSQPNYLTLTLSPETLVETIDVSGVVESERQVNLKATGSGQVLRRAVLENRRVAAGQLLLELDGATPQLQLAQAQANAVASENQALTELETARKALAEAETQSSRSLINLSNQLQKAEENVFFLERELARSETLTREGVTTAQALAQQRQQLEQARRDLLTARNNLTTAQQSVPERVNAQNRIQQATTALANARRQGRASQALSQEAVRQTRLLAPFAGTVTIWQVQRGDYVAPGTPVAQFQDLRDIRLNLAVNELDFPRVRLQAPVSIRFDAYPDVEVQGSVVWRSEASTPDANKVQVFPVKVWFANPDQRLKPGMSGDAQITVARRERALAVPIGAVTRRDGQNWVKRLEAGKPVERPVKLGISTLEKVEVTAGLQAGDQIVLEAALPVSASSPQP
ncbi:MAG: efflux RND transporter periplasmic adaptor subunit [Candidatus Sericytochromatia bacterium]